MNKQGSVCIVVVNYNGFEISRDCIESLLILDYPSYCIVFVDNGSSDKSGEKINDIYKDKIVYVPLPKNLGVTGGNNAGIDYAVQHKYDYIMFLNNDTVVDAAFLGIMVRASEESRNALVVPKIFCYYDQSRLDHFIGPEINWWTAQPLGYSPYPLDCPDFNIKRNIKVASTCCLLVPTMHIAVIGKMDEEYFMYYDDSDFTIRASRAGFSIIYEPEAVIYHKCNTTTRDKQPSYFEFYLQNRNVFYFYNKLCDKPLIKHIFLSKCLIKLLLIAVKSILYRKSDKIRTIKLVLRDVLNNKMGPVPNLTAKH